MCAMRVASGIVICLMIGACSGQRKTAAEQYLREEVAQQSANALTLVSFSQTNGYEQTLGGVNLYVLEWEGVIEAQLDAWKESSPLSDFYWTSFRAMRQPPSAEDLAWARFGGQSSMMFVKGATIVLTGDIRLQKTDNGWRPMEFDIKTSRILNNQRSPAELAELQQQELARALAEEDAAAQQRRLDSGLVGKWRFSDRFVWFFADGTKTEIDDGGRRTNSRWSVSRGVLTETEIEATSASESIGPRWPAQLHVVERWNGTLVLEATSGEIFRATKSPE
jgi:hypothetical protein